MLRFRIVRDSRSLQPKRWPEKPDDWGNNDANNSLDIIELYDGLARIFSCSAQTVVNIPGGRYLDTVAPGMFLLKAFVEPRKFWGRIHGICNTFDLEGQEIDGHSIEPVPGKDGAPISIDRWLMHDTQKLRPSPAGILTRVAWSAGCFVVAPIALTQIGFIFDTQGIQPGDLIAGELVMAKEGV